MGNVTTEDLANALAPILAAIESIPGRTAALVSNHAPVPNGTGGADPGEVWKSLNALKYYDGSDLLSDPNYRTQVIDYLRQQGVWPDPPSMVSGVSAGPDVQDWADPRTFAAAYVTAERFIPGALTGFNIPAAAQVDLTFLKSLSFPAWIATFWRSWGGGPSGGEVPTTPPAQAAKAKVAKS
jgi:hypothetical protein